MSRLSLLKQGKIPAGTVCPFRVKCHEVARGECKHRGYNHTVEFSCPYARAHDIGTSRVLKIGQNEAETDSKGQS